jgi:hypothetical protein
MRFSEGCSNKKFSSAFWSFFFGLSRKKEAKVGVYVVNGERKLGFAPFLAVPGGHR